MKTSEFDFPLPDDLIAQQPSKRRDDARLMVIHRGDRTWEHRKFHELPAILTPAHFLVINNTRVFAARLTAHRARKEEEIEVFLVRREGPSLWRALIRPGRKAQAGERLAFSLFEAEVVEVRQSGERLLRFHCDGDFEQAVEQIGAPPLPPYIRRSAGADLNEDRERYQTIFAKQPGSIAAPTAALHFTQEVVGALEARGIHRCEVLLHIGYGTFKPVRAEEIEDHFMDPEYFEVSEEAASCIRRRKETGQRLVAVGSTATRVLEHLAHSGDGEIRAQAGECRLFIHPGFHFRLLDALLTNFHLPRSTLIMLAAAFAGREFLLECYREAVRERYRFFSYGDAMLIL